MPSRFPQALTLIALILALSAGLTWLLPAGSFDREILNGRETVIAGTYRSVPAAPQGMPALLIAPFRGLVEAAEIIAFVLLVGGAFGILEKTGAVTALAGSLSRRLAGREWSAIPTSLFLFSAAGTVYGMSEETLPLYAIYVPLMRALGYDALTGMAVVFLGAGVGVTASTLNPFAVGIAQALAGIPPGSGLALRLAAWIAMTSLACAYVMRYAARVRAFPREKGADVVRTEAASKRQMSALAVFATGMLLIAFGVTRWGWYVPEISGVFTAIAVAAALAGGLGEKAASQAFLSGAAALAPTAVLIGFSRGILILAGEGRIVDPFLNASAQALRDMPMALLYAGMLGVQSVIGLIIPSSSGHASLTLPVLAPLADLAGFSRQGAVTAFHFASGFANLITPTSGVLVGALGIAGISFSRWLRFILPLLALLFATGMALLILGESFTGYH